MEVQSGKEAAKLLEEEEKGSLVAVGVVGKGEVEVVGKRG